MQFWLDLGIDGFRTDAVPYLYEREDTNCENLPETHIFLKKLRAFMDKYYPGRVLLCEANQWPEDVRPYFGDGDEFHMGFHFPVMPRIFMAIHSGDGTPVVDILKRTPTIPENCQWCTFLRNHDELTLEMVTEEERQWMWQEYAPEPRMRLNLGIRRRLAPLLGNDRRKIELANSLLFTLPGSPIVYYGDEIGMGDNIWLTDRNGVRTPMQWNTDLHGGFSKADAEDLYAPVIDDDVFGYEKVNVDAQRTDPNSLYHTIKTMIAAKKQSAALQNGNFEWIEGHGNKSILAYLRSSERNNVLVVQNLSSEEQTVTLSMPQDAQKKVTDILKKNVFTVTEDSNLTLTMQPYEYLWLQI